MGDRFGEFEQEIKEVNIKELTQAELTEWLKAWTLYIVKGGVRPPKPH